MLLSLLFKVLRYSNCEPEIIDFIDMPLCDNLSQQYAIAVRNPAFSAHKLCLIIPTSVMCSCFIENMCAETRRRGLLFSRAEVLAKAKKGCLGRVHSGDEWR